MSETRLLVLIAIVAVCGMSTIISIDRNRQPSTLPIDDVRKLERGLRAQRPVGDPKRKYGLNYQGVLSNERNHKGTRLYHKPTEPMPPTLCHSVEPVLKQTDSFSGPDRLHDLTVSLFETESGFGFWRMKTDKNERGVRVSSRVVDRVELVSLLTAYQPSVYVLDEMATPALARQARRRPLDEFERLGLDAVRRGEELVWTREASMRMFGAIRARTDCLDCHAYAKVGDLLGAFTYYLNAPVDKLNLKDWERGTQNPDRKEVLERLGLTK